MDAPQNIIVITSSSGFCGVVANKTTPKFGVSIVIVYATAMLGSIVAKDAVGEVMISVGTTKDGPSVFLGKVVVKLTTKIGGVSAIKDGTTIGFRIIAVEITILHDGV